MKTFMFDIYVTGLLVAALTLFGSFLHSAPVVQEVKTNAGKTDQQAKLIVQLGHSSRDVTSVAFSPDGNYVLTGSNDQSARLWELATGREIRQFVGHTGIIERVGYSPDGSHVLTLSDDGMARLWEVATGREIRRVTFEHSAVVSSVTYSPDFKYVATGGRDKTVRIFDLETGREATSFKGNAWISSVAYSPDGRHVVAGSIDHTAKIWEVATATEVSTFKHSAAVESVTYSPDGKYVLTGSLDKTAHLWEVETGREIRKFSGHEASINCVAYSPDGQHIITGSTDQTARIWSMRTGKQLHRLYWHFAPVLSVAFSPKGQYVLTGGRDGRAVISDVESGTRVRSFQGYSSGISSVVYSTDARQVLTVSHDLNVRVWDVQMGRQVNTLKGHTNFIKSVVYSPDSRFIVTASSDKTARLWDPETGAELRKFEGHSDGVDCVAYSPDGRKLLTGSRDNTALLWDPETGRQLHKFEGHSDTVNSVAFSSDGNYIVTGGSDKTARLWEVETGRLIHSFEVNSYFGHVSAVAFSPNDEHVLTVSDKVQWWDVKTGRERTDLRSPSGNVQSLVYSQNKLIFTGRDWNTALIWDWETGKELRLEGHSDGINSIAFSPDGKYVLTGGEDSTARFWDASTGAELCSLVSLRSGDWVVVDPKGRFDTNNLEDTEGLYWLVADDPMRPLPLEIFLRDYYEPRLLPRILNGEQWKKSIDLSRLNRVQPKVEIKSITQQKGNPELVTVTVEVSEGSGLFKHDQTRITRKTGVYDLRLFRQGRLSGRPTQNRQLVAQMPFSPEPTVDSSSMPGLTDDLLNWRRSAEIKLDQSGRQLIKFENIRLPLHPDVSEVEFSAYAFNEDRIKSPTDRKLFRRPGGLPFAVHRQAYIISVGVNSFENPAWNLRFAANDARLTQKVLFEKLNRRSLFDGIVQVSLISDAATNEKLATKANVKAVFDLLSGKKVAPELIQTIPNADKIKKARPEDLVLFSFSSHGYSDDHGNFYLFPADVGTESKLSITHLRQRLISSEELSLWLREVDAGDMVMIVDACHSAAAVGGSEFKPGPMGSRGLGQLSYDKGVQILTATQADNVAIESGGAISHGLLTYALLKEGLESAAADFRPKDMEIQLREWLEYAEWRVPKLYEELATGKLKSSGRDAFEIDVGGQKDEKLTLQRPSLFDFRKGTRQITLGFVR